MLRHKDLKHNNEDMAVGVIENSEVQDDDRESASENEKEEGEIDSDTDEEKEVRMLLVMVDTSLYNSYINLWMHFRDP